MELNYEEFKIKNIFINILLKRGKKTISENIFKNILIDLKKKTKQKPFFILLKSIKNLIPKLKLISMANKKKKKRKNKFKNKYFLMYLNKNKQIKQSILWFLLNSKLNYKSISNEIFQTFKKKSKSIETKKKHYKEIKKLKFNILF